jgi:2-methylcitrate dehydratase PrpD
VTIHTFEAATMLARVIPSTTEEAQFSLIWPVASALVHGRFGVDEVLGNFDDERVRSLFQRTAVLARPELTAQFPGARLSEVTLELTDGRRVSSGTTAAPGEPGATDWEEIVSSKATLLSELELQPRPFPTSLAGASADELLALLAGAHWRRPQT